MCLSSPLSINHWSGQGQIEQNYQWTHWSVSSSVLSLEILSNSVADRRHSSITWFKVPVCKRTECVYATNYPCFCFCLNFFYCAVVVHWTRFSSSHDGCFWLPGRVIVDFRPQLYWTIFLISTRRKPRDQMQFQVTSRFLCVFQIFSPASSLRARWRWHMTLICSVRYSWWLRVRKLAMQM